MPRQGRPSPRCWDAQGVLTGVCNQACATYSEGLSVLLIGGGNRHGELRSAVFANVILERGCLPLRIDWRGRRQFGVRQQFPPQDIPIVAHGFQGL